MNNSKAVLARNLARALKRKKMKPAHLATRLGLSRSTVHSWLHEGNGPRLKTLIQAADELDTTVARLLGEAA